MNQNIDHVEDLHSHICKKLSVHCYYLWVVSAALFEEPQGSKLVRSNLLVMSGSQLHCAGYCE